MYCINRLKSIVPPQWIYRKKLFLAKTENVPLPTGKKVFIFLAANYGNLGDIAITYAQHKWLGQYFSNYEIVEVPSNCTFSYLKGVLRQVETEDIITFVGGGNMGDMYSLYENIRQLIVSMFPDNKIIQFPLTADFSSSRHGRLMLRSARQIYSKHGDLTILAREKRSEKFLSDLLKRQIQTVPDIVLTLDCLRLSYANRKGVSVCLRQDKEKTLSDEVAISIDKILKERFHIMDYTDTLIDDASVTLDNKQEFLHSFLQNLSTKQLLVTDRLHGMIFAYITGTPAIVFSNSNQKVKYSYEWIKDCGYILYMDSYEEQSFIKNVDKVSICHVDKDQFLQKKELFNRMLLEAL